MRIENQLYQFPSPFYSESGAVIEQPQMAFEQYGLTDGPVIVLAHGGLSSHHAAGRNQDGEVSSGWWQDLVGPDKVFDTNKYRIISTNALGSMYGTSSALTVNPATGKSYARAFPDITMVDQAHFLYQFLQQLNIRRIAVMAGPSMGSLLTLQMAALYPDFVEKAISVATAGRMTPDGLAMHHFMINAIEMDTGYQAGNYDNGQKLTSMQLIAQLIKIYYMHENIIKTTCWDGVEDKGDSQPRRSNNIKTFIQGNPEQELAGKDPNCLLTTLKAINSFDLGKGQTDFVTGVKRIQCPVLLMNIDTDREFSPKWAEELAVILNEDSQINPQVWLKVIRSDWGHLGCLKETEQISKHISAFLRNT